MTGLERVARALCELDANPSDATMDGKPLWQDYLPEAWAAIMAVREPDPAMIGAGGTGHHGGGDGAGLLGGISRGVVVRRRGGGRSFLN